MDLLRQILARLPLQRLVESTLVDNDLIRIRARVVNRLSDTEIAAFRVVDPFRSYLKYCTYQGELSRYSGNFALDSHLLLSRAAFLRDSFHYSMYATVSSDIPTDPALLSDDWQIQKTVLANKSIYLMTNVIDPEAINWTPQLIRYYYDNIPDIITHVSDVSINPLLLRLMGYLQFPLAKLSDSIERDLSRKQAYWESSFRSWMLAGSRNSAVSQSEPPSNAGSSASSQGEPPSIAGWFADFYPEATLRRLYSVSEISTSAICAYSGYYSPFVFANHLPQVMEEVCLEYIQPSLLKRLPRGRSVPMIRVSGRLFITPSLVERAREMLPIVIEHYPNQKYYRTELEILLGMPVSQEDVDSRQFDGQMITVAHPQMGSRRRASSAVHYSTVYYDLVRYFGGSVKPEDFSNDRFSILFAAGQYTKLVKDSWLAENS